MSQDEQLTALQWVEKYYYHQKPYTENPEARAAFFKMDGEERSKLGGFVILDSVLALKQTEAENKKSGNYTAQDTINRLQAEVAFLYFQWLRLHKLVGTLMDALANHENSLTPEEYQKIKLDMVYLQRLAHLTGQIEKHWSKDQDQDQWPFFID